MSRQKYFIDFVSFFKIIIYNFNLGSPTIALIIWYNFRNGISLIYSKSSGCLGALIFKKVNIKRTIVFERIKINTRVFIFRIFIDFYFHMLSKDYCDKHVYCEAIKVLRAIFCIQLFLQIQINYFRTFTVTFIFYFLQFDTWNFLIA